MGGFGRRRFLWWAGVLFLQGLSLGLVNNDSDDHMIITEGDYVPVFQDELFLDFDKCTRSLSEIFDGVAVCLGTESELKMMIRETVILGKHDVIQVALFDFLRLDLLPIVGAEEGGLVGLVYLAFR